MQFGRLVSGAQIRHPPLVPWKLSCIRIDKEDALPVFVGRLGVHHRWFLIGEVIGLTFVSLRFYVRLGLWHLGERFNADLALLGHVALLPQWRHALMRRLSAITSSIRRACSTDSSRPQAGLVACRLRAVGVSILALTTHCVWELLGAAITHCAGVHYIM